MNLITDRTEVTFWEHFVRVLPRRPNQAVAALYWYLTRRRLRARNRLRAASADLPFAYEVWIAANERGVEREAIRQQIQEWPWHPRFLVMLYGDGKHSADLLNRSIGSIEEQAYPFSTLAYITTKPIHEVVTKEDADYIIPLRIGDVLSKTALFRWAEAARSDRGAAMLYGDQDQLDARGTRRLPWFKPRWNQEMFLAQDYLSAAVAIESCLAKKAAEKAKNMSELRFQAALDADGRITHVPHIMCHVGVRTDNEAERIAAVSRHVQSLGATCRPGPFGTVKINWPLPTKLPLVSIIVPTKDKLELLQPCVETVLTRTDYNNFEILIVDNASSEKQTEDYFARIARNSKVRVLRYPNPYNFSAINNFAARQARGSYLCLLNNDTEVVETSWLAEMMRYAVQTNVGAVGAKLLYEDGSIQHAGVVVGIGEAAGHAHRFLRPSEPGYFGQAHVAQFVSAVTAACLVVERRKFLAVGGLDEANLAVAFNDVDLCLKLEAAGWQNVYTPHAVLIHHESKSRGKDTSPQNIQRYRRELKVLQERWNTKTYDDPLHNPNLDRYSETFVIRL